MKPPKFPLDRTKTYGSVRGIRLFFNSNWSIRYNASGKRYVESLGTQDDTLAWTELQKANDEVGTHKQTAQEFIGAKHHTTSTVAEAAKLFVTQYTTISLGTHRKIRRVLQAWVVGEDVHPKTGTWTPRADAHIARPFGKLETHVVAREDVKTLLARVRQTVNQYGRPNSRGFAKQVLDAVRLLFNWLIDEGLLKGKDGRTLANPAARAGRFTFDAQQDSKVDAEASGEEVHVFEPEQQQKLEAWFQTYCRRLYPMILTGFCAGLRYGEVIALELADIDLTRHVVKITKHWTPDGVMKGTKSNRLAKGKLRTRTVPTNLDPRLEPALQAHINNLKADPPAGWDGKRLFPAKALDATSTGSYIRPANFYNTIWNRACHDLGIKDLTYHNARHTFASTCLHAGATPQEVASWLGDTLEVFYRHYAHVIQGLRQDRAGLLSRPGEVPAVPESAIASKKPLVARPLRLVQRG
jgi:integrase